MPDLKKLMFAGLAAAAAILPGGALQAQSGAYPSRPITVIVPFAPGGSADVLARVLGERAGAELGQAVVVDNRSGGDGVIGAQAAARARPDGYTILQLSTAHAILPSLRANMPYDLKRDFVPVFGATGVPQALAVSAKSNIRSLADLAAAAKAMPNGINYASGGTGSISHLTAARVVQSMKAKATHVPYRGLSNAVQAVVGDQVQFTVVNIPDVLELTRSGALRLLAVTSEQRLPYLPNVPTLAELRFPDAHVVSWSAYVAPVNTPPEVIARLHGAYTKAASDPAVHERLAKIGVTVRTMSGSDLGRFLEEEAVRWRRVIEENDIKLEN
jgi:tripartite-type tricarboxylate transporter receptor subunit TctC